LLVSALILRLTLIAAAIFVLLAGLGIAAALLILLTLTGRIARFVPLRLTILLILVLSLLLITLGLTALLVWVLARVVPILICHLGRLHFGNKCDMKTSLSRDGFRIVLYFGQSLSCVRRFHQYPPQSDRTAFCPSRDL
jgi:hypothetical protein